MIRKTYPKSKGAIWGLNVELTFNVVGINVEYDRQTALYNNYRDPNHQIVVSPEPTNPHDPKALKVKINGSMLGYIPKKMHQLEENYPELWAKDHVGRLSSVGVNERGDYFCEITIEY